MDVELCYDDGDQPFARETLSIADIGVSDRVIVVNSETLQNEQKRVATSNRYIEFILTQMHDVMLEHQADIADVVPDFVEFKDDMLRDFINQDSEGVEETP
jgi:hypothetical protein